MDPIKYNQAIQANKQQQADALTDMMMQNPEVQKRANLANMQQQVFEQQQALRQQQQRPNISEIEMANRQRQAEEQANMMMRK